MGSRQVARGLMRFFCNGKERECHFPLGRRRIWADFSCQFAPILPDGCVSMETLAGQTKLLFYVTREAFFREEANFAEVIAGPPGVIVIPHLYQGHPGVQEVMRALNAEVAVAQFESYGIRPRRQTVQPENSLRQLRKRFLVALTGMARPPEPPAKKKQPKMKKAKNKAKRRSK